jgi:tetratricopeptide (TPR) repeat protein
MRQKFPISFEGAKAPRMNPSSPPPVLASEEGLDAGVWYDLGCVYLREKRYQEALSALEHAKAIDPDYPLLRHATLWAHFGLGDWSSSLELGSKCGAGQPNGHTRLECVGLQRAFSWRVG